MKKLIVGLLFIFSSISHAGGTFNINPGGELTAEQRAQIELQAAQMAAQNAQGPIKPQELTKWVEFGQAIGQGLAGTATELGVAADEIANTKVGMFAMILIAWQYAGNDLVSIVFGLLWLIFTIPVWIWLYRRQFILEAVSWYWYEKDKHEDGKRKTVTYRDYNSLEDGLRFMYWLTLLIVSAIGILPILF